MFLTTTNLLSYLMGRGLLTADAVVDGELAVMEAGRRNRNFKVMRGSEPGLFVKQALSFTPAAVSTLQREAAFYNLVRTHAAYRAFAALVPRIVHFEPSTCTLVVELVNDDENLTEHHARVGTYPLEIAEMLGRALGECHAHAAKMPGEAPDFSTMPRQAPWILGVDARNPFPPETYGEAGRLMTALLPQFPNMLPSLHQVAKEWRFDSVLHGDMKWDNLLLVTERDGRQSLRVVDWELVDLGDASWDVASIVTAYLSFWMWSAGAAGTAGSEAFNAELGRKFGMMRQAIARFWTAYASARGLTGDGAEMYLARCLRFSAARLVLTVFECLFNVPGVTPAIHGMLQVSQMIAADPVRARGEIIGADTPGVSS